MAKYSFLYRDASNYKFHFEKEIDKELFPGDEITIEELGFTIPQFFNEIILFPYDPKEDHNIVDVIERIN